VIVRFSVAQPDRVLCDGGRPLDELVRAALSSADLVPRRRARLVLAVNAPGAATAPSDEQPHRDVETHDRDLAGFLRELEADLGVRRRVALADVAYSGGRELALERELALLSLASRLVVHACGPTAAKAIAAAVRALARAE
jgi:hypothetical protein